MASSTDPSPSSRFEEILDSSSSTPKPTTSTPKPTTSSPTQPPPPPTTTAAAAAAAESTTKAADPMTGYTTFPYNSSNRYIPPKMPPLAPKLYTEPPILKDTYITPTSKEQNDVSQRVRRFVASPSNPFPALQRPQHAEFLAMGLSTLPSGMTALDASKPWLLYWTLVGLSTLGLDISEYKSALVSTLTPLQNESGGFGGGYMQLSHLAPSYAAILCLTLTENLGLVNRVSMTRWLASLQQKDGSFTVSVNGEVDVRATYCALTIISLLRLPTDGFDMVKITGFLCRCQTYEGGFGATPYNESHGGYAFCALAALMILHPPSKLSSLIDLPGLTRWLSARQYAPEGGLSGRTNKLVDGCYSTWVGGCWAFVEAAHGVQEPLWSREGLCRYILTATQNPRGGLRDKPGKGPDFYHSAYVLMGLSAAQYSWTYEEEEKAEFVEEEAEGQPSKTERESTEGVNTAEAAAAEEEEEEAVSGLPLLGPFRWRYSHTIPGVSEIVEGAGEWPDRREWEEAVGRAAEVVDAQGGVEEEEENEEEDEVFGVSDRVVAIHPVYNIPYEYVVRAELWGNNLIA